MFNKTAALIMIYRSFDNNDYSVWEVGSLATRDVDCTKFYIVSRRLQGPSSRLHFFIMTSLGRREAGPGA